MTAMLVLGITTTSVAYAEEHVVNVTNNGFFDEGVFNVELRNITVVKGDTVTFVNTHDGDNQSLEPHAISDPFAVPYTKESYWIIDDSTPKISYIMTETKIFYDRFFDVSPLTVTVGEEPFITGDGTIRAQVYGIPFDVTILEGGTVVYHNNDPIFHHDLQHTGTTGTEKGGTFSMWAGSNGGTATANFPVEDCSSCYPAGVYSWMDSVSGVTGTITILPNPNTVNEQVGIQENVVVVLNKPEPTIQTNSTVTTEQQDILDKTKSYKTQIEEKINAKIKPLETEIIDLKKQVDFVTSVNTDFVKEINLLKTNATISEIKYLEESKINKELREKLSTLESQVVDTTELEKYKKDASNWKAVALEQLRVMAEILGLF